MTSADEYLAVFLDQRFIGTGSRIQEAAVLLVTAAILAGVMRRARATVLARLHAEEERSAVTRVFGQYVPGEVVDALLRDRGALDPVEREATVLFTDLQGFTAMTERLGAGETVSVLNAYFTAAAEVISRHGGVVTQFQGDAVVATFNVPVAMPGHADAAVQAGREICALTDQQTFHGTRLTARVGIATGPVVAGSVGGGGRQTYTVHGDTVNLAARLEAMNKSLHTRIAIAATTRQAARATDGFREVAATSVRGQSGTLVVYTLTDVAVAGTPGDGAERP